MPREPLRGQMTNSQACEGCVESCAQMYEAHKYKDSASALEESTKLGGFEGVLSSNLALGYYQLGERQQGGRLNHNYLVELSYQRRTRRARSVFQRLAPPTLVSIFNGTYSG